MTITHLNTAPETGEHNDQRIAIVVYGPSTGGKTTTARALGRILERPIDPGNEDDFGRTIDFDWLEFEGGSRNGAPVHVQLVTAPGHDPARRIELLSVADVVMFVADTTAERMDESVNLFAELTEEVERLGTAPAVVVQANKRDEASALPIDVVRRRLDLDADAMVIETIATTGEGVRKAFVFAMRHGIQRLDERKNRDPLAEESPALDKATLRRRLEDLHAVNAADASLIEPPAPVAPPAAAAVVPPTPVAPVAADAPAVSATPVPEPPLAAPPLAAPGSDTTASLLDRGVPPQLAGPSDDAVTPPPPAAWDAVPPPRRETDRASEADTSDAAGWRRLFSRQR